MSDIRHHVHPDLDSLTTSAAMEVTTHLNERIAESGRAVLSLTGGSAGVKTAAALATAEIEWERVTIYFGDERFVAAGDPERNDGPPVRRPSLLWEAGCAEVAGVRPQGPKAGEPVRRQKTGAAS